ncbi:MAG: hypothetical protein Q4G10_00835 [Bacteroidia bacterium]|nr:hypothetical protein [Bacteroidia bacterium]
MKVFLLSLVLIGLGVFGMCFNIIFRKDGKFPEYEVSQNKEMRKRGIRCMHEEEEMLFGDKNKPRHESCSGEMTEACKGCVLFKKEQKL